MLHRPLPLLLLLSLCSQECLLLLLYSSRPLWQKREREEEQEDGIHLCVTEIRIFVYCHRLKKEREKRVERRRWLINLCKKGGREDRIPMCLLSVYTVDVLKKSLRWNLHPKLPWKLQGLKKYLANKSQSTFLKRELKWERPLFFCPVRLPFKIHPLLLLLGKKVFLIVSPSFSFLSFYVVHAQHIRTTCTHSLTRACEEWVLWAKRCNTTCAS